MAMNPTAPAHWLPDAAIGYRGGAHTATAFASSPAAAPPSGATAVPLKAGGETELLGWSVSVPFLPTDPPPPPPLHYLLHPRPDLDTSADGDVFLPAGLATSPSSGPDTSSPPGSSSPGSPSSGISFDASSTATGAATHRLRHAPPLPSQPHPSSSLSPPPSDPWGIDQLNELYTPAPDLDHPMLLREVLTHHHHPQPHHGLGAVRSESLSSSQADSVIADVLPEYEPEQGGYCSALACAAACCDSPGGVASVFISDAAASTHPLEHRHVPPVMHRRLSQQVMWGAGAGSKLPPKKGLDATETLRAPSASALPRLDDGSAFFDGDGGNQGPGARAPHKYRKLQHHFETQAAATYGVTLTADFGEPFEQKRSMLNDIEKARREDLKSCFHRLRDHIPKLANKSRAPKGLILKEASSYITLLAQESRRIEMELQQVRLENQRLRRSRGLSLPAGPMGGAGTPVFGVS